MKQIQVSRIAFALSLVLTSAVRAETIHFDTMPKPVIESRLAGFANDNGRREQALHALFEEAGCSGAQLSEQIVKHSKAPNVICTLPGNSDRIITVGAHFDFVNSGKGVIDNWSGASLLPSLFQSLKSSLRRHTFIFIGFTDEEKGMIGSRYYIRQFSKEDLGKTSAMVNLDSLGTSPTKLEMDRGNKGLANALAAVAQTFELPLSIVNVHGVGRSDSDLFQDRKVATINLHSLTNESFRLLHTRGDRMDAMKLDDYYDSYRLITAYLAYLDELLDKSIEAPAIAERVGPDGS